LRACTLGAPAGRPRVRQAGGSVYGRGGNGKSRLWARRPGRDAALLTPPQASEHGSASSELLAAKLSACGGEVTVAELAAGDPTGQSTVVEGVIYAIRPVGIDDAVVVT
jgi:hypothetical protein